LLHALLLNRISFDPLNTQAPLAVIRRQKASDQPAAAGLPPKLFELLKAGGIFALLEKDGSLGPRTATSG